MILQKSLDVKQCLVLIILLSFVDAMCTMAWVLTGIAKEGNPLMDILLSHSYALFVGTKIGLTYLGVLILNKYKETKLVMNAATIITIVYIYIVIYHLIGFVSFLMR